MERIPLPKMSDSKWIGLLIVILSSFRFSMVKVGAHDVCYFGEKPDPNEYGKLRWVVPADFRHRCSCTTILPGGVNIDPPKRDFEPFYTDHPLITDNAEEVFTYFGCLEAGMEYPVIELDGARWRLFWWYQANTTWPASVTDVLKDNYGDCDVNFPYCFSRLPDALQEDGAEILANDSAGTVYRWKFSSSNSIAHAAWGAFLDGIESTIRHADEWKPTVVQGNAPKRPQDSFQYKDEFGVKSFMLDDDNCGCDSTLSMGHAMCYADQHAFQEAIFGVDLLYHEETCTARLHVPRPTNGLSIFFKDIDDCIGADCPDGFRCLDGINSFTCTGN